MQPSLLNQNLQQISQKFPQQQAQPQIQQIPQPRPITQY